MADPAPRCEPLAGNRELCEASLVIPKRLELRWCDGSGAARVLGLPVAPDAARVSARQDALEAALRIERAGDEVILRAMLVNRGDGPIELDSVIFRVATGLPPDRAARFFKQGYQSWSDSRPIGVGGDRPHYRDQTPELVRLIYQSETARPPEFREAATSEMFTIVESDGIGERVLAGFIGGALQLAAITVATPAEISARAMLDGATLAPGAECEIEPLMIVRAEQPAARLAARWASKIGGAMNARVSAPYQRGWCSWYQYFHGITEEAFRANLQALAEMRAEFPLEVVQLDDGFQSALGDWDTTNAKFPGGLKRLAGEIRAAGFEAGIWTAPFLAARDSQIMSAHPQWFLRDTGGEPLKAGYNTNWTTHQDGFAYALDPTHPAFTAHLSRLFGKLTAEFGYSYLKLDFLYAAAAQGARHDQRLTRAQALRRGLAAIRSGAGERTFILGCGCPLGPAIGIVDGMRIGGDVSPGWTTGTRQAIDAIIARSFMHRRLWLNDPDCLMLRQRETSLNANERGALAAAIAVSGGMLLLSDDMSLLGPAEAALFRSVAKLGAEADGGSFGAPALPPDLMKEGPIRVLKKEMAGYALAMILNRGDEPERVTVHDPDLEPGQVRIVSLEGAEDDAPASIELAPHSAAIVRMRR